MKFLTETLLWKFSTKTFKARTKNQRWVHRSFSMQLYSPRLVQNPSVKQRIRCKNSQPPLAANLSRVVQFTLTRWKSRYARWCFFASPWQHLFSLNDRTAISTMSSTMDLRILWGCTMTRIAIARQGWVRCVRLQGRKCNYSPASALLYWSVVVAVEVRRWWRLCSRRVRAFGWDHNQPHNEPAQNVFLPASRATISDLGDSVRR